MLFKPLKFTTMRKLIWEKLHAEHEKWNREHPQDSMPFDEWLDEQEGRQIRNYRLERDPYTEQIIVTKNKK